MKKSMMSKDYFYPGPVNSGMNKPFEPGRAPDWLEDSYVVEKPWERLSRTNSPVKDLWSIRSGLDQVSKAVAPQGDESWEDLWDDFGERPLGLNPSKFYDILYSVFEETDPISVDVEKLFEEELGESFKAFRSKNITRDDVHILIWKVKIRLMLMQKQFLIKMCYTRHSG